MNIQELKSKTSENLISEAEKLGIENASTLRKQDMMFACLLPKMLKNLLRSLASNSKVLSQIVSPS